MNSQPATLCQCEDASHEGRPACAPAAFEHRTTYGLFLVCRDCHAAGHMPEAPPPKVFRVRWVKNEAHAPATPFPLLEGFTVQDDGELSKRTLTVADTAMRPRTLPRSEVFDTPEEAVKAASEELERAISAQLAALAESKLRRELLDRLGRMLGGGR